jgi:hypothetical protein
MAPRVLRISLARTSFSGVGTHEDSCRRRRRRLRRYQTEAIAETRLLLRPKLLIAVTGYGDPGAKEMTARAGFDYHLVKPVKFADFKALLDSVVQSV